MDNDKFWDFVTQHEIEALDRLGAELKPVGLIMRKQPDESALRRIGVILAGLFLRMENRDDRINWAVGDWMNQVDEGYGPDKGVQWMNEFIILTRYKDHLLKLSGAILLELQCLEQLIKTCCGFLGVAKGRQKFTAADLLSHDAKRQRKTLGWFKDALKECKDVKGDKLFAPHFESRLDQLVRQRNLFIHGFWFDVISASSSFPPSIGELTSIDTSSWGVYALLSNSSTYYLCFPKLVR